MSASGKSVCSQDSEWLPTGTSWITFWTAIDPGSSGQHTADGTTREVTYLPGQTRHFQCAEGEYLLHDLENVGDTELVFSTVEFLDSANPALPLY